MSRPSIVAPVYKSIVRAVSDTIDVLNQSGLYGQIGYHNWEERGPEKELPKYTLIGIDGFSFQENGGLWEIRFSFAISSYHDYNLLNEIELLDEIQKIWGEGEKVPLLEMVDGEVVSQLHVAQFRILPMAQSELRNYRTLGLELLRT